MYVMHLSEIHTSLTTINKATFFKEKKDGMFGHNYLYALIYFKEYQFSVNFFLKLYIRLDPKKFRSKYTYQKFKKKNTKDK